MADEDYLQEGFDPRSVTVPRLRSILVTHNVAFGNAKKPQLVALVEEHVLPLVPRLREQRAKAKRSSMGIVNAGSAEDNGHWDDYDLPPPSTSRRSKSPRKSSARVKTEDFDDAPALRSPSKRTSRSVSRAISQAEETPDYEAPRSIRRTRRTVTPQIKDESEEDVSLDHEESVFTDDNPFQSGSSPPQTKLSNPRRRTSQGARLSRHGAEEYDEPKQLHVPKVRRQNPRFDELEPGEEFTPDEQLELEEATHKGEVVLPPRESRNAPRRRGLATPIFVLILTLLGSYGVWYRQEKLAVGYCGSGRPPNDLIPPELPDFIVPFIDPPCETCPQHAYCFENFEARCEAGFILEQHPLSLGGLIPLPPTCEPDSEKARRVQAVADKAVEELRERRAKFECGELVDDEGNKVDSPAIPESELKETVSRKKSKRLNSAEFEDLWNDAIGAVVSRDEVETKEPEKAPNSSSIPDRELSSTSLARIPLTCAIKRSIRLGLARNRLSIGLLVGVIVVFFYVRSAFRKHTAIVAQVPQLVDTVLKRLAHQKELGEEGFDDPWLFLPNLRDDVLRSTHSVAEREHIWRKVKAVVEQNSNVRTSQREGRSGEVGRAWEWIGPVSEAGVMRRRSGRVSFGNDTRGETPEPQRRTPEVKKWDEPRPVY